MCNDVVNERPTQIEKRKQETNTICNFVGVTLFLNNNAFSIILVIASKHIPTQLGGGEGVRARNAGQSHTGDGQPYGRGVSNHARLIVLYGRGFESPVCQAHFSVAEKP